MSKRQTLKRGTRMEWTYALGKIVTGRVIREYRELAGWYLCEVSDDAGTYRGGFCAFNKDGSPCSQFRITDNRA